MNENGLAAVPVDPGVSLAVDEAAGRVQDGGHADVAADVPDCLAGCPTGGMQPGQRDLGVGDTPVRERTKGRVGVGVQGELVAGDLEADVERLVELRVDAEQAGEPGPAFGEVDRGVDDRAQSQEHGVPLVGPRVGARRAL